MQNLKCGFHNFYECRCKWNNFVDLEKLFYITHSSLFEIFFKINQSRILIIAFMYAWLVF